MSTVSGRSRFPISFDSWFVPLSTVTGLPASSAYVEIAPDEIDVRMGWAFRSRFPRSAVVSTATPDIRPLSRGVHGWRGQWLVNGSGRGIVSIQLNPPQRGYVMGFPVRLRELLVSVADPAAVISALT